MSVKLNIISNPLNLAMDELFLMAARVNKKRGFLFVSKVLGKHLPVHPLKPLLTSGLLAIEHYENATGQRVHTKPAILNGFLSEDSAVIEEAYQLLSELNLRLGEDPIIIGFAETATSLGHAFFDCIKAAFYIHTTRESVDGLTSNLEFEEEHSHAVDQHCFIDISQIDNQKPIILVDDEITTGKTAINIIRNIHAKFPRRNYSVISILDWRSENNVRQFLDLEKELDITINTCSLISGEMVFDGEALESVNYNYSPLPKQNKVNHRVIDVSKFFTQTSYNNEMHIPYINETGRFGITNKDRLGIDQACADAGKYLSAFSYGAKTLCLGTGEFMYLPMKISAHLGKGVKFHSTTRSPILPEVKEKYAIQNGFTFFNPEDLEIVHYIYNIPKDHYDEVYLFFEKEITEDSLKGLMDIVRDRGIQHVNIVICSKKKRSEQCE
ncbi:phosphoribosyltransferase family protein [Cytobacillus sp. S13-E01]|nr:phosphoribosyltransferase family protein [Cytobacillus sp. S13-E01]MDF0725771.1 phosphoribosyltransferase family protein [Cytobacillus sp. S13-E01]MDF0728359.1 phosphoribosyltransferase family protein [Cytobacillus sp. S13-E01]